MGRSGRFVASTDSPGEVTTRRRANTRDYRRPGPCNEFPALSARCSSCDVAVTEPVAYVQPAQTTLLGPGDDQAPEAADAGMPALNPEELERDGPQPARAPSVVVEVGSRRNGPEDTPITHPPRSRPTRAGWKRSLEPIRSAGRERRSSDASPPASYQPPTSSSPAAGSDELAARRAVGQPARVGARALRQVPATQPNFRTEAAWRADRTSEAAPCPSAGSAFARARCRRSSRAVQHRPRRASASICR